MISNSEFFNPPYSQYALQQLEYKPNHFPADNFIHEDLDLEMLDNESVLEEEEEELEELFDEEEEEEELDEAEEEELL